jgi:hypothetical protein
MHDLGWNYSLSIIGLSKGEFEAAILTLPEFVSDSGYYYSAIEETDFSGPLVNDLWKRLK